MPVRYRFCLVHLSLSRETSMYSQEVVVSSPRKIYAMLVNVHMHGLGTESPPAVIVTQG